HPDLRAGEPDNVRQDRAVEGRAKNPLRGSLSVAGAGYQRDLRGYGRNPPDPQWPGKARGAVQFVVNFEEGGENNILHGDRASEAFLSDVLGAQPWPGQRHANIESMFEYGSRARVLWARGRRFCARTRVA